MEASTHGFLRQNMGVSSMFINHKPRKHFFFAAQFGAYIWSGFSVRSVVRDFGADTEETGLI